MTTRTRNQVIAFQVTSAERRRIRAKVMRSGLSQLEHLLKSALNQPIYAAVSELAEKGPVIHHGNL